MTSLGPEGVIAVGNGTNDALMLACAGLGIAIAEPEGTSVRALQAVDVVARGINIALEMLINTKRMIATLRVIIW